MNMNMKMQVLINHLKIVNTRIQAYKANGGVKFDVLLNWVCYDFLDKILASKEALESFDRVYFYFDKLVKTDSYKALLSEMFALIIELGVFLSKKEVLAEEQKRWGADSGYINRFKYEGKASLSTELFAKICVDRKNYYELGARGGSLSVEDIAPGYSNITVLRQFKMVNQFYSALFTYVDESKVDSQKILAKISKFDELINRLENLIVVEPVKLHFKSYRWLRHVIYEAREPGNIAGKFMMPDESYLDRIKESTVTVLEDLILESSNFDSDVNEGTRERTLDGDVHYLVKYENRNIFVNGILLGKTRLDSVPDNVFQYIYDHPGEKVTRDKLQKDLNIKINRKLTDIISDLGFKGDLREVFFPGISKSKLIFVRSVTYDEVRSKNLPLISFGNQFNRKNSNDNIKDSEEFKKAVKKVVDDMPPKPAVYG